MSAWNDLVSKIFKENKGKNANYKLKDAMMDAKKVYKKSSSTPSTSTSSTKKSKKSRKSRKGAKSRKTRKSRK